MGVTVVTMAVLGWIPLEPSPSSHHHVEGSEAVQGGTELDMDQPALCSSDLTSVLLIGL